jgi:hypothetical protein
MEGEAEAGVQAGSRVSLQRIMQKSVKGNGKGVLGGEWCEVLMVFRTSNWTGLEAHAASASLARVQPKLARESQSSFGGERCRIIVNEGGA